MNRGARRWLRWTTLSSLFVALILLLVPWLRVALDDDAPSRGVGRVSDGKLVHGHVFAPWGPGYHTYSFLGATLGRQYAVGQVRDAVRATFAQRAKEGHTYVLGETAVREGGPFHGHRTHQTGLSVDIFMPVRDADGTVTSLPTWPWQGFGYGWDFDDKGRTRDGSYRIDFAELASFLAALHLQATAHQLEIVRVIITPEYVPLLIAASEGRLGSLADKLTRNPVWVRHDEHVHVDFRPR